MADAILYGVTQEILKNLGSRALNEIASAWRFKDDLEKLKRTVNTINNVLLDAEDKQAREDGRAVRGWLDELAIVVYEADDLFDEFNTIASRNKLLGGNKVTKEVCTFFSASNQIAFAFKLSRKIKSIQEKLEAIRKDGAEFGLAQRALQQGSLITERRDETYSFVAAEDVIGRDADKKVIVDLLLTENEHELGVLPIVGLRGMGKTTLAQLIYNDSQVGNYFESRFWVWVGQVFDIKVITEKMLKCATNAENPRLDMEQFQSRLRNEIGGKKYMLILDDVWEENPNKWAQLRDLLKTGRKGSKILVTTRSKKVADIMRTFPLHELQGLSEQMSWNLFEKIAFKSGDAQEKPHLVKVGKEILKKCANSPLAIKTLGGLLLCEDESKWLSYKDTNLVEVEDVLKLSYQHLLSPLKNCFAYSALFPKGYEFDKEMLIELWIAEGFVIPDGRRNLEDIADDYFRNLLQRGFFQVLKMIELEDIKFCEMHDLMHDLAEEEAKAKCIKANSSQTYFKDTILHLSFDLSSTDHLSPLWEIPNKMQNLKLLRTFLHTEGYCSHPIDESICQQVLTKLHHLRVLNLWGLQLKNLPSSIGKLIHLRYLNLSESSIETLPNLITNLYNLQTLNLESCWLLKTLPIDIQKLANIRSFDVSDCHKLTHMPSGIGALTLLHNLPRFIVRHEQSTRLQKQPTIPAQLSDLRELNNLRGELLIDIRGRFGNNNIKPMEVHIGNKHRLTKLNVTFDSHIRLETSEREHDEVVLESLKPHCNLRSLNISYYGGEKLPSWALMRNLGKNLSNLVDITLKNFKLCKELPFFSQLRSLKSLALECIYLVEYMEWEVESTASISSNSEGMENIFFPSLEQLELYSMKNLKGWRKEVIEEASTSNEDAKGKGESSSSYQVVGVSGHHHPLSMKFPKLSKMSIEYCPNLIFMPLCPNLEDLKLNETNKKSSLLRWSLKLKRLVIDDVEVLISLSQFGMDSLSYLQLCDKKMERTERLGDVIVTLSSSLQTLEFFNCDSLRSIPKGLDHLTALESLVFYNCKELELSSTKEAAEDESEEADADLMPWNAFKFSLHSLKLSFLPKVVNLPSGIQNLTSLHYLKLSCITELREIPEWISCLSSLRSLELYDCPKLTFLPQGIRILTSLNQLTIFNCPGLTERCRSPNGTDWPIIRHIQSVVVQGVHQTVEAGENTR